MTSKRLELKLFNVHTLILKGLNDEELGRCKIKGYKIKGTDARGVIHFIEYVNPAGKLLKKTIEQNPYDHKDFTEAKELFDINPNLSFTVEYTNRKYKELK